MPGSAVLVTVLLPPLPKPACAPTRMLCLHTCRHMCARCAGVCCDDVRRRGVLAESFPPAACPSSAEQEVSFAAISSRGTGHGEVCRSAHGTALHASQAVAAGGCVWL